MRSLNTLLIALYWWHPHLEVNCKGLYSDTEVLSFMPT